MSATKTRLTVASAACLAISCTAVEKYEGYAPTVVPDRLAGGLPTGGFGETEGVKLGETHDKKFWADRLVVRLAGEYDAGIGKCIHVELPDGVRAIAISTAYNAGVGAVCGSPMVAKWNAGDILGGCLAIRGWRISSRPRGPGTPLVVQRGLVNRRKDEAAKCLAAARAPIEAPAPIAKPKDGCTYTEQGAGLCTIPAPKYIATDCGMPGAVDCRLPPKPKPKPPAVMPAPKSCFLPWIFKCKT